VPDKMSFDDFNIRQATLQDLAVLVRHRRVMFVEATGAKADKELDAMGEGYSRHIQKSLPTGNFKAWIIETKEHKIAASGGITVYEQPPRPQDETLRYVYVHSIYTEPEFRRRGIARKILTTIVDYCRDKKFKTLTLHAVEASRPLYESFGFKPTTEMRMFL
jgi:GNAT superfamily N-acetyltransferase